MSRLFIVRHAHRDKEEGNDNGLSEKGTEQAVALMRALSFLFEEKPKMVSSPKQRCKETLLPLSKKCGIKISIDPKLDEQQDNEGEKAFSERIKSFVHIWTKNPAPVTLWCSHGDWIPYALDSLIGQSLELKKGGFAEVILVGGKPKLSRVVQVYPAEVAR